MLRPALRSAVMRAPRSIGQKAQPLLRRLALGRRNWPSGPVTRMSLALLAASMRHGTHASRPEIVTVRDRSELSGRSGMLASASPFTLCPPIAWDAQPDAQWAPPEVMVHGVGWTVLDKALVNDTSLVLHASDLIGPPGVHEHISRGMRLKGPGIIGSNDDRALIARTEPAGRVDRGIRLLGPGSGNWYHWLVEILPVATLVDMLPDDLRELPLIVPEVVLHRRAWRDALEHVLPERELIAAPRYGFLAVDELVWIDPAVHGARTLRDGIRPALDQTVPSLPVLERFRRLVRDRTGATDTVTGSDHLMLVRPDGSARRSNQDELIGIARRYGLRTIDPGTLTFREQVHLFAGASTIVGGWGAAWSSMLFADDATRGLMWAPDLYATWPLYSNLAPVSGMTLHHLHVATTGTTFREANKAEQYVPPHTFETALRATLQCSD